MNRSRSRLLISFLALSAALTAAPPLTPLGIYRHAEMDRPIRAIMT
jgi:hypothetical protein